MPTQIDYIADWAERLRSRLYTQFRGAVTWNQWVDEILGPQFQDLEDAAQSLLTLLDIDDSEGVQLDRIGRIVGQSRLGLSDSAYRTWLRTRIAANRSTGASEDIVTVLRRFFGDDDDLYVTTGRFANKDFTARFTGVITRSNALSAAAFLGDAKEAGARGVLQWQESATSALFTLDSGPGFDTGVFAGAIEAVRP